MGNLLPLDVNTITNAELKLAKKLLVDIYLGENLNEFIQLYDDSQQQFSFIYEEIFPNQINNNILRTRYFKMLREDLKNFYLNNVTKGEIVNNFNDMLTDIWFRSKIESRWERYKI